MNCQTIQTSFLDQQAGLLSPADAERVNAHVRICPECQRAMAELEATLTALSRLPAPEPSPRMRENFRAMLREFERAGPDRGPFAAMRSGLDRFFAAFLPSRPAVQAACLVAAVAAGALAGMRFAQPAASDRAGDTADQRELNDFRADAEAMPAFVSYTLTPGRTSSTDRLQDVLFIARSSPTQPNRRALGELVSALTFDSSTNVRQAALETLYGYRDVAEVRAVVRASLPRDPSPLMQINMMDFLISIRDQESAPVLETLARNPQLDQSVREAARRGLTQL